MYYILSTIYHNLVVFLRAPFKDPMKVFRPRRQADAGRFSVSVSTGTIAVELLAELFAMDGPL